MLSNFERCLERFFKEHPHYDEHKGLAYAFMYTDAAVAFMETGDRREALKYLLKSFRYHPWEPASGRRSIGSVRRAKLAVRTLMGEDLFTKLRGTPLHHEHMRLTWEADRKRGINKAGQEVRSGS
jgi:hypothetical protein